jgi:uncharacterized protein YbjT (DUF2867 family)
MYAIVGATGNTGRVVTEQLLAAGQKVRAIGRSVERLQPLASRGAEPLVAEVTDAAALAGAFRGARALYAVIPQAMDTADYRVFQQKVVHAIAEAVSQAEVEYVVSLSSIGADHAENTGPVAGLHHLEGALNQLAAVNVLHLRAGYFMENTLAQIDPIRAAGIAAGPLRPDLKLPMIATRDIGAFAAQVLLQLNFTGKSTQELLGERDLSMEEVAAILGNVLDKPDLRYLQVPDGQVRAALLGAGMSPMSADLMLELAEALNSRRVCAREPRSARNTTPTSYERFAREEFLPRYRGALQTA